MIPCTQEDRFFMRVPANLGYKPIYTLLGDDIGGVGGDDNSEYITIRRIVGENVQTGRLLSEVRFYQSENTYR